MKFIRKGLWPTAIVAAFLMLVGALGSAVNADTVKDGVETGKGGAVYIEVELDSSTLTAALADAEADVTAAQALVTAATDPINKVGADIVAAAKALSNAANKVGVVVTDINDALTAHNAINTGDQIAPGEIVVTTLVVTIPAATAGDAEATALVAEAEVVRVVVGLAKTALVALKIAPDSLHEYTVDIDDGSGSASIVATLEQDADGDADIDSNRATGERDVTAFKVNNAADRNELEDYFDAEIGSSYVLVVVECTEFGSYNISFTHAGTGEDAEADLECATDVGSAVLSASASTIFTTDTEKLTSKITVTLTDEDGDAAAPGDTVRFKTDNCEFTGNEKSDDIDESDDGQQGRHDC